MAQIFLINQNRVDALMDLSVVIPVFNESENISATFCKLKQVLAGMAHDSELIFVDDGSSDQSFEILRQLKSQTANGPAIRILRLSRNFGQHSALAAGFSVASGKTLVTIDADGQIDPKFIEPLVAKIHDGYDFVSGIRRGKGDSVVKRRMPSHVLNWLIGNVIGRKLKDYGCPLNAMKIEIARKMREYGDMQRFFKPLAIKLSRTVAEIEVQHEKRQAGKSKYGILDLVDLFFDFVTNFSKRLFQRVAMLGVIAAGIGILGAVTYLCLRFVFGIFDEPAVRIQFLIFSSFLFGTQLILLGILGEFVVRIYRKIGAKPLYEIKEII